MRLLLEIIRTTTGKHCFKVYDHLDSQNSEIIGTGWSVREAINDFVEKIQKDCFYDDDTPLIVRRDDLEISTRKLLFCKNTIEGSIS